MFARSSCRALLLLAASACAPGAPSAPDPVRGVLLVTIDTLRADCAGGSLTPEIERLAAAGVVVEDAFTPTPTTGPAHASLFLGRHPWRHGVVDNAQPLAAGRTLAEVARAQGYRTAAVVSSFVLDPQFGFGRGFDDYRFEPTQRMSALARPFYARGLETTELALQRLDELARDGGRFFLWVHYFDPHFPYGPPAEFERADEAVDLAGKSLPSDNDDVTDVAQLAPLIRRYRGEVRYVDAALAPLLARLDELGLAADTAVIVTADHGEGLGDHGLLGHGENLFDELVRVPLVIRAPGLPAGARRAGPAQLEDLFPTIASLLGARVEAGALDGFDLVPWLRGDVEASPRPAAVGRRKPLEGEPTLYYEWRAGTKWIGAIDAPGRVYAADGHALETTGEPGDGAPAWLRLRTAEGELGDAPRGELDPAVEEGLRALGYAK